MCTSENKPKALIYLLEKYDIKLALCFAKSVDVSTK